MDLGLWKEGFRFGGTADDIGMVCVSVNTHELGEFVGYIYI